MANLHEDLLQMRMQQNALVQMVAGACVRARVILLCCVYLRCDFYGACVLACVYVCAC